MKYDVRICFITLVILLIRFENSFGTGPIERGYEYSDLLPKQLLALPAEEIKDKVSLNLLVAAQEGANPEMRPVIAMRLGILMYPAATDFVGAIKDFQTDLGEIPSGELTVGQLDELDYRNAMSRLEHLSLDSRFRFFRGTQVMRLQGSIRGLRDEVAHPINRVQIVCQKINLSCVLELLELQVPTRESDRRTYNIYHPTKWNYEILEWKKGYMVLSRSSSNLCAVFHLYLDFNAKVYREEAVDKSENCEWSDFEEQELSSNWEIVDGYRIQTKEFEEIKKQSTKFLSKKFKMKMSDYMRKID